LADSLIPALYPDGQFAIDDDGLEKLSALFLSNVQRRKSVAFSNVPPHLSSLKDIDHVARGLIPTFVYCFFFNTPPQVFRMLYVGMVGEERNSGLVINNNKSVSQKSFYAWKNWSGNPKGHTKTNLARVLDSSFRWQESFTAERTFLLHGLIANLEKPSPYMFFDCLLDNYSAHYSFNGRKMSAYFVNIFGEDHVSQYSPPGVSTQWEAIRAGLFYYFINVYIA
jgi:hypothetical protein